MGVLNQHLGWQAPGGVLSTTHLYSCCQQRIHHERIQHLQHSFVGEVCEQPPGPGLHREASVPTLSFGGVFLYSVMNVCSKSPALDILCC